MKKIVILFLLIIPISAQSDNTAPVLKSFSFTPDTINTTNSSADVLMKLTSNDDLSGFKQAWVRIKSPSGNNQVTGTISSYNDSTLSGNGDHSVQKIFNFSQFSEEGDWQLTQLGLTDSAGNNKYYEPSDFSTLGLDNKIHVISITDNTAPVLKSFSFTPDTINTTNSSADVLMKLTSNDDLSGFKQAWVRIKSPSGNNQVTGTIRSYNDSTLSGNGDHSVQQKFTFSQFSEEGDWQLTQLGLTDSAGNNKYYEPSDFSTLELDNKIVNDPNALFVFPIGLTTKAATSITKSSAYLNGFVSTYGGTHQFYFQYGKDSNVAENEKDVGVSINGTTASFNTGVEVENLIPLTNYSFRLISKSSSGSIQSYGDTLQFLTPSNTSPVISIVNDITVNEDASGTATLGATDADGDAITYSAVSDTNAITVTVSSITLTLTPNSNWHGVANIKAYASDGSAKDSTSFKLTVTPVNDAPTVFEWVSIALDTINITQSNLDDTYTLQWDASTDVDGDSITYLLYAGTGASPKEEVYDTTSTSLPIPYQELLQKTFEQIPMLSRATVKFSVSATDGIDTVKVTGDDRVLFVNRYEYLSIAAEGVPLEFALHENYPNPFNPTTTLRFDLPELSDITLTIYNMLGQKVRTFDYQNTSPGYHSVTWDATNDLGQQVGAGVYLYQLQAKDFVKTRKMVLLK